MTTVAIYVNRKMTIHETDLAQVVDFKSSSIRDYLVDSVLYNCTSYIEEKTPEDYAKDKKDEKKQKYAARGNCTEQGLIRFYLEQCGD